MNKIPFLDLRLEKGDELDSILSSIKKVLVHGKIINGPEVIELENKIASFCNRKYCVGVNSGTDALYMGLKSLGICQDDEVITTSLSWVATANAIAMTGAKPVFADIKNDLNIDPASVERLISKKTKAIVAVHYTGRVCDIDRLRKIVDKNELYLVEDAAQAFGAEYRGHLSGSFGDVACFSMNPMKVYAALGEAGLVLTDDRAVYDKLTALRYNGTVNKEECLFPGLNGRMDTIQAAVLLQRFEKVFQIIEKRRQNAAVYHELLKDYVTVPGESNDETHVFYTYTIQTDKRDELKQYLENHNIETKIQHPILMSAQVPFIDCRRDTLKCAKRVVNNILCLPANEKISKNEIKRVCNRIKEFFQK